MDERQVELKNQIDVVAARQMGREMARGLGFGSADQTRLATAISELARNAIQYAGEGLCAISDGSDQEVIRVRIVVEDHGPGIPDVKRAMEFGFSTRHNGLGAGLPGSKRLVHEFHIESEPGHTKVTIAITQPRRSMHQTRKSC